MNQPLFTSKAALTLVYPPTTLMLGRAEIAALSLLAARITAERDQKPDAELSALEHFQLAQGIYQSRRHRDYFFDSKLFSEPAWDMLLAAYCFATPPGELTVTGLCHASSSPPTTALRWVQRLTRAGMLERCPSKADGRMIFVTLTSSARERIEAYFCRIGTRFISPAIIQGLN